jgi:hypothetical protein
MVVPQDHPIESGSLFKVFVCGADALWVPSFDNAHAAEMGLRPPGDCVSVFLYMPMVMEKPREVVYSNHDKHSTMPTASNARRVYNTRNTSGPPVDNDVVDWRPLISNMGSFMFHRGALGVWRIASCRGAPSVLQRVRGVWSLWHSYVGFMHICGRSHPRSAARGIVPHPNISCA